MKQRISYYIHASILLACALIGTASFFFFSDIIGRSVQALLHLETEPSFTGGRVSAVFYDPIGDDNGFGSLTYPTYKEFKPGALDLVRYTVHEPVYNAQWSNLSEYWQLDLAFSSGPANVRSIRIYIDTDNEGFGAVQTKTEFAEGVSFDSASPWDYVIAVHGSEGTLEKFDGSLSVPLVVTLSWSQKDMTIRVPLAVRELQRLYTVGTTRQYVCIGAWSPWGRDGFAEVKKQAASGIGGGAISSLTPKLYDLLVPEGMTQRDILGSWNDDEFTIPVLYPVVASMVSKKGGTKRLPASASFIMELEKDVDQEIAADREAKKVAYQTALADWKSAETETEKRQNLAIAAFEADENNDAEKAFDSLLSIIPDDPICLAYKGSLVAKRAGDESPLAAIDIVTTAYSFLDRSVGLADSDGERLAAYYNRGFVSMAVPDQVFGKALSGAEDFLAAAETLKKMSSDLPTGEIASAYCNAAICYEIAGKDAEAGTWFMETARLAASSEIGADVKLELARRGYINETNK